MNRVNVKCAILPRKTWTTSLWRHKVTSKCYEEVQENCHFVFIVMRSLLAYSRENFISFFFYGAFKKGFMLEVKEKYRGMFEIQKSGDKTSSGEIGLDIRTHASPKVGQDQVSGGVSVLCWHAAPVRYCKYKGWVSYFSAFIRGSRNLSRASRGKKTPIP